MASVGVAMALDSITRRNFSDPDRAQVQESAIQSVEQHSEKHLAQYRDDPRSFGGRYVSADLFKETFPAYAASPDDRNRYNAAVHNSAAVLSAEQLRQVVADSSEPERNTVVFLTGIPGAGKTSSVLQGEHLPYDVRAIFEGQLARPESVIPKVLHVLDHGLKAMILVVHAEPVNALGNTVQRFEELGRGASIEVMAEIQGRLPDGLARLREEFGDKLSLQIYDVRDRANPKRLEGWDHLGLLRSEGSYENIKDRLTHALEKRRETGQVSDVGYRQALGLAPPERVPHGLDGQLGGAHEADDQRRSLSQERREKTFVRADALANPRPDRAVAFESLTQAEALSKYPDLSSVYEGLSILKASLEQRFPMDENAQAPYLAKGRLEILRRLDKGEVLRPPFETGRKPGHASTAVESVNGLRPRDRGSDR